MSPYPFEGPSASSDRITDRTSPLLARREPREPDPGPKPGPKPAKPGPPGPNPGPLPNPRPGPWGPCCEESWWERLNSGPKSGCCVWCMRFMIASILSCPTGQSIYRSSVNAIRLRMANVGHSDGSSCSPPEDRRARLRGFSRAVCPPPMKPERSRASTGDASPSSRDCAASPYWSARTPMSAHLGTPGQPGLVGAPSRVAAGHATSLGEHRGRLSPSCGGVHGTASTPTTPALTLLTLRMAAGLRKENGRALRLRQLLQVAWINHPPPCCLKPCSPRPL
jgi:hypothetical protein